MLASRKATNTQASSQPAARANSAHTQAVPALETPAQLAARLPLTTRLARRVEQARATLRALLDGRDDRLLVIVGPCSLHDHASAIEYARRLHDLAQRTDDELVLVMRCYLEKPRTRLGWKGLVNDPRLDGSFDIERGLGLAHTILLDITKVGLPCASELLDPISVRYVEDLLAWGGIGARTCESQPHRELASDLPAPVGIKNATHGDPASAIDAIHVARARHATLGIGADGSAQLRQTRGNRAAHLVLRGGERGPNFDGATIETARRALARHEHERPVIVDCSHGNSRKQPDRQALVFEKVLARHVDARAAGANAGIAGLLLESHLLPGRQDWSPADGPPPCADRSITDACIGWGETERLLLDATQRLREGRA